MASEPVKAQMKLMSKLGWQLRETDDTAVAVWAHGIVEMHVAASWAPADAAECMTRIVDACHKAGSESAQRAVRLAMGLK